MTTLQDNISTIRGIGEKRALAFGKLGIYTLYDLLSYFPMRYEDRSVIIPIAEAADGIACCISAIVADEPRLSRIRRGMELVKFRVFDSSGSVDITYFNQSWMKNNIQRGEEYVFYGRIEATGRRRSMTNPVYEKAGTQGGVTGAIVPVYRLNRGLTQKNILQSVKTGLEACAGQLPEPIPEEILLRLKLSSVRDAYENVHFPTDFQALSRARKRLVFEELFLLACAMHYRKSDHAQKQGLRYKMPDLDRFYASLPFSPTTAQLRAVSDALQDMTSGKAMNRLLQGDVGSGKTLCAAALAWATAENGYVTVLLAPTEILTEQHTGTLRALLSPLGLRVEKLTGAMTVKEKRQIRDALERREIDLLVGTHALLSDNMSYPGLGLVITDEQHRFGVGQRAALAGKNEKAHVLVMSATPIPRTLALIIYGDLDVSILDELPPGRQRVETFAVDSRYRERLNRFIVKQAENGHQVFVVCPAVEESEDEKLLHLKSAENYTAELRTALPSLRIACVHGRMKPKEKEAVMDAFSRGETDVLVSTTVIEVGVDVPNATLMIVENAERFGLSQLHQLRGRVGRGKEKSTCVLVSDTQNEETKARLSVLCKTSDGFQIAEEDLRLRGPGDFFGARQHGLPEMHVADLGADTAVLKAAKAEADALFEQDPYLSLPSHTVLRQQIERMLQAGNCTLN
ncbi:MAG: ATP-dependent DNA helicase RecG [Oscillospiraceae bacterium]|nr:ATP-dependent DNA helicase RecG [Oscillospiraceae bacterium]